MTRGGHIALAVAALGAVGAGAFVLLKRGGQLGGATEATELKLFCENDGALYRQQRQPIEKNLKRKIAKGTFDRTKSVKAWEHLATSCAQKYAREFGGGQPWHKMFTTADRRAVAKEFADEFVSEHGRG